MTNSAQKGFSFIEIVIAMTIIGILGAIVVPNLVRYLGQGKKTATQATLKTVQTTIEQFHGDTNAYPSTLGDLQRKPLEEKIARRWGGPYLSKEPLDGWGNDLVYRVNPKGTQPPYELYSWGPHGEGSPQDEWMRAEEV